MLFPVKLLDRHMPSKPKGVLHVGAHQAEESQEYIENGWGHVIWIEAQPELAENLRKNLNNKFNTVIEAVAWSQSGEKLIFNVANNGQSSSLYEFGSHSESYPEITFETTIEVTTRRLDEILDTPIGFNFINLDIQGAELEALKGLSGILSEVKYVYTEVNKHEVYRDCATFSEIDAFLMDQGFKKISVRWVPGKGWGDSFYARKGVKVKSVGMHLRNIPWNMNAIARYLVKKTLRRSSR